MVKSIHPSLIDH